jgi:HTH-type transcriptional regulator, transcriptional repressor of NAD biosynthesis genes
MSLGVTIGKFYPLHRGHDHLIRSAKAQVERLVVIVGERPGQELSGSLRASWIRELHPEVEVVVSPEDIPNEPGPWAERTLAILGQAPDLAFTSEDYGQAWAEAMGCPHVAVDPPRATCPTSGTALRADLAQHWGWLTPPAKAHFCRRVVVVGVESSGTTTLARALAEHFRTTWAPEYGRSYWEGRRYLRDADQWSSSDFERIAAGQRACEEDLARRAERVLFCDTDPLATAVWERRYLGPETPLRWDLGGARRDLYLLTAPDFPFVQDGTRESEHLRAEAQEWFLEALEAQGAPWILLEGSLEDRLTRAREAVQPLLSWAPLGDPAGS